jgi:hypothetical protein
MVKEETLERIRIIMHFEVEHTHKKLLHEDVFHKIRALREWKYNIGHEISHLHRWLIINMMVECVLLIF